jgi:hypothetical protein
MGLPLIFVMGPAGAGKSTTSDALGRLHGLRRIEMDRNAQWLPDERQGLEPAWRAFTRKNDAAPLAAVLRQRARDAGAAGTVLSMQCTDVPGPQMLRSALASGVTPVVLYGTGAECLEAYLARGYTTGLPPTEEAWWRLNSRSYALLSGGLYAPYRVPAFEGGRRRPLDDVVRDVWHRVTAAPAGPG